ncbi:hypothetical protein [Formosa sp. PL04]|uniref:hypothetical protein n=1 Tax=Formosa sp. PL04 TaxID=3081755 RepID=UPI002980BAE3|nr:hypothetical protein [Formosa sp. PL04]MDW5290114.1 hypothetical protein [Formosa sp. PL04]
MKTYKCISFFFLLSILTISFTFSQELKPSSLFCDHMVLQQGMEVPVWIQAKPYEKVPVSFAGKPDVNLVNNAVLPAYPFRTDNIL